MQLPLFRSYQKCACPPQDSIKSACHRCNIATCLSSYKCNPPLNPCWIKKYSLQTPAPSPLMHRFPNLAPNLCLMTSQVDAGTGHSSHAHEIELFLINKSKKGPKVYLNIITLLYKAKLLLAF